MPEHRRSRISRDRANMVERALVKAGYLSEGEAITADLIKDAVSHIVADLLHLASREGVSFQEGDLYDWVTAARDYFRSEGGNLPRA